MKYYVCITKIYTHYKNGTTYKYLLYEINELTFFKYKWMFNVEYNNDIGYIIY